MIAPAAFAGFPSPGWFAYLVSHATEEPEIYQALGFTDFSLAVEIVGADGEARTFGLVFDGYDISSAGALDDVEAFRPDATITGPLEVWEEMVANIAENHGADRGHTLNALSIADAPLQVVAADPLGKDKFFRYAETLQTLFDASARDALART